MRLLFLLLLLLLGAPGAALAQTCNTLWLFTPEPFNNPAYLSTNHSAEVQGHEDFDLVFTQNMVDDFQRMVDLGCQPMIRFDIEETVICARPLSQVRLEGEFTIWAVGSITTHRYRDATWPQNYSQDPKREVLFDMTGWHVPPVGETWIVEAETLVRVDTSPFWNVNPLMPDSAGEIRVAPSARPLLFFQ